MAFTRGCTVTGPDAAAVTSSAFTWQIGSSYQPSTPMTSPPLFVAVTRGTHLFGSKFHDFVSLRATTPASPTPRPSAARPARPAANRLARLPTARSGEDGYALKVAASASKVSRQARVVQKAVNASPPPTLSWLKTSGDPSFGLGTKICDLICNSVAQSSKDNGLFANRTIQQD
jgi:hypothetical protein